eukprot:1921367-Amphidinium_carterae.1
MTSYYTHAFCLVTLVRFCRLSIIPHHRHGSNLLLLQGRWQALLQLICLVLQYASRDYGGIMVLGTPGKPLQSTIAQSPDTNAKRLGNSVAYLQNFDTGFLPAAVNLISCGAWVRR